MNCLHSCFMCLCAFMCLLSTCLRECIIIYLPKSMYYKHKAPSKFTWNVGGFCHFNVSILREYGCVIVWLNLNSFRYLLLLFQHKIMVHSNVLLRMQCEAPEDSRNMHMHYTSTQHNIYLYDNVAIQTKFLKLLFRQCICSSCTLCTKHYYF